MAIQNTKNRKYQFTNGGNTDSKKTKINKLKNKLKMSIIKMTHRKSFLQIFTQFEYAITSQKQTERCGEMNSDIPFIPTSFF